ncbi:MAG: hypothetical protein KJ583_02105 [Nanoarchaeota archaeon]|nr:hypothetical protein [Nanoarchaeota archaeon]MBU1269664.1 hypothetical protein [Nanoarchaeota archaeon]MBU1604087.1 hypothetical protein [Nanoarchaeota archaeon]MBU2443283.1 hypothetical protein [Nanoarchaeota archaeon]
METDTIKNNKNLLRLIDKSESIKSHPIMNISMLDDSKINIRIQSREEQSPQNKSVWPIENNLIVERAKYENNNLYVIVTNVYIEPIRIISTGVKYTLNDSESIDFKPVNIQISPGELRITIPCPKGNPTKFVIRTENQTAVGNMRRDLNW